MHNYKLVIFEKIKKSYKFSQKKVMDRELHEQYEYARQRIKQKKWLYFHFILMLLGIVFSLITNKFLNVFQAIDWYLWITVIWIFLFVLHFINVNIINRFMNKNWERNQIDRLIEKQQNRIKQLQNKLDQQN